MKASQAYRSSLLTKQRGLMSASQHFSSSSSVKQSFPLNAQWEKLASKELRGKDVKETLVRETNEQMHVKPLYTSEDWSPPKEEEGVELPGKYMILIADVLLSRRVPVQERSVRYDVHGQTLDH